MKIFRMGDSFRSAAWDSQLDNMLDDLQQVMVWGLLEYADDVDGHSNYRGRI